MIQRIQTIYLALAAIISSTLTYVNIVDYVTTSGTYVLQMRGVFNSLNLTEASILENNIFTVLVILTILLPIYTLFLYKKRKLQLKLTLGSMLLNVAVFGWIFAIGNFTREFIDFKTEYSLYTLFPIFATIVLVLAYLAIKKDEDLIKSLNRIR